MTKIERSRGVLKVFRLSKTVLWGGGGGSQLQQASSCCSSSKRWCCNTDDRKHAVEHDTPGGAEIFSTKKNGEFSEGTQFGVEILKRNKSKTGVLHIFRLGTRLLFLEGLADTEGGALTTGTSYGSQRYLSDGNLRLCCVSSEVCDLNIRKVPKPRKKKKAPGGPKSTLNMRETKIAHYSELHEHNNRTIPENRRSTFQTRRGRGHIAQLERASEACFQLTCSNSIAVRGGRHLHIWR